MDKLFFLSLHNFSRKSKPLSLSSKVFEVISDKQDIYLFEDNQRKKCTHNGCDQTYVEGDGTICSYHPGPPIFHEGLKGWGCCSKRVITFEEFLIIPGCTIGTHTDVEPLKPPKQITEEKSAPKLTSADGSGVEHYTTPLQIPLNQTAQEKTEEKVEEEQDPPNAVIEVGAKCRRNTCNYAYVDENSRKENPCVYHPGTAIFHEGAKGWTCCFKKKSVCDFNDFLNLPGCSVGNHKFLPFKSEKIDENVMKCRTDWYQVGMNVIINIYAKNVDKEKSSVIIDQNLVKSIIKFKDGKVFNKDFKLPYEIVPEKSKYEILTTKVEIKLLKVQPYQWNSTDL